MQNTMDRFLGCLSRKKIKDPRVLPHPDSGSATQAGAARGGSAQGIGAWSPVTWPCSAWTCASSPLSPVRPPQALHNKDSLHI